MPIVDLEIAPAGPTHGHFHQDLARTRLRHGTIDYTNVARAKKYSRTHCLRNGVLLYTSGECQRHAVLRMLWLWARWRVISIHAGIHIRQTLNVSTDETALSSAGETSIMSHPCAS